MTAPIRPVSPEIIGPIERSGIPLGEEPNGPSFQDTLAKAVGDVTRLEEDTQDKIAAFVRGEPIELHEVMAASEEAALSLQLLVEMRNKLTEAYRTLMNMQT